MQRYKKQALARYGSEGVYHLGRTVQVPTIQAHGADGYGRWRYDLRHLNGEIAHFRAAAAGTLEAVAERRDADTWEHASHGGKLRVAGNDKRRAAWFEAAKSTLDSARVMRMAVRVIGFRLPC